MLSIKFKFFKWEISIRNENLGKLHITDFHCDEEYEKYELKHHDIDPTNTAKRICALAGDHGMIDYIFRGLGHALLRYQGDAVTLLDGVMRSLSQMRKDLWLKGATTIELDFFDNKVHKNFCLMLSIIKDKADDPNNEIKELDKTLYNTVKQYDIITNYQNGNVYK